MTLINDLEMVLKLHVLLQIVIKYELVATRHSVDISFGATHTQIR